MLKKIETILFFFSLYYFSFFYVFYIYNIGNSVVWSFLKEAIILVLFLINFLDDCLQNKRFAFHKPAYWVFLAYLLLNLFAMTSSTDIAYVFVDAKYFVIWPMMIWIGYKNISSTSMYNKFVLHVTIITTILCVLGIFGKIAGYSAFLQRRSNFSDYAIKSVLSSCFDFGALTAFAAFLNLTLIDFKKPFASLIRILFYILFAVSTFYSFVRGNYLLFILLTYFYLRNKFLYRKKSKQAKLIVTLIVDVSVVLTFFYLVNHSFSPVFNTDSLLMRLNDVWPSFSFQNALLGNGYGTFGRSEYGAAVYSNSDNSWIRVLLTIGVFGVIMVVFGMLFAVKNSKEKVLLKSLFISISITCFFCDLIIFTPAMVFIYSLIGGTLSFSLKNDEKKYRHII